MILHIIEQAEWNRIKENETYSPLSLNTEGFIHCCTLEQVTEITNIFFKGKAEILLLCLDEDKVDSKIVYEDLIDSGQLFPHIYGPLNLNAVYKIVEFYPNKDGVFQFPNELLN